MRCRSHRERRRGCGGSDLSKMGVQFIPDGPAPAPTSLPPVARSAPPDSQSSGSNRPDGAGEWCDIAIDVGALADILAKNAGWRWRRTIFAPPARGVIAAPPRTFAHTEPARSFRLVPLGINRPDGAGEWCDIAIDVGALADILAKNAGWRWRRTIFAPPARGVIAAPPRTFAHTEPARSSLAASCFLPCASRGC